RDYFMSTEAFNLLTAVPAYLMSTLKLTITPATQAQVDLNAAPTLVISSAVVTVEVHQFYRDSIPDNIQFILPSWEFIKDDTIATSPVREIKFPAGGHYSFLMARSFNVGTGATTAKQADTGATATAPFTPDSATSLGCRVFDLSRFTKYESSYQKL